MVTLSSEGVSFIYKKGKKSGTIFSKELRTRQLPTVSPFNNEKS